MKPVWRSFVLVCLVAWCGLPAGVRAQQGPGAPEDEIEPVLTEIGVRFAMGSTTFRRSIHDYTFGVVAHAEPGYSLGLYGTLWRHGWLRLQTEFLYSERHTTLAETSGSLLSSRYSLAYLELPVLTRVDLPLSARAEPFVALGVSPGILVDAKHSRTPDLDGVLHRLDFGLVGAAGARIRLTATWDFTVELRGVYGLAEVFVRTPRKSSALFLSVGLGYHLVPHRAASRASDGETDDMPRLHAKRVPARNGNRASPRSVQPTSPRQADPSADLAYGFAPVPQRCVERREARMPAQPMEISCVPGVLEPGSRVTTAQTTAMAMLPAGVARSPAVAWSCTGAPAPGRLLAGDAIDHVLIATRSRTLHVHMRSGRVYCYPLRAGVQVPPHGTYQGSKAGLALTIQWEDTSRFMTLVLQGLDKLVLEAWRRLPAGESFPIVISATHGATEELGRVLTAKDVSRKAVERLAGKLADDSRLTVQEAQSLADALARSTNAGEDRSWFLPFDENAWQAWLRRYGGNRDAFGPVQDRQSPQAVKRLLTRHKQALGLADPPVVTARQRQQQVAQDPELIAAWNGLEPWERELWQDYWQRLPRSTQGSDTDLSLTEDVRFRIALQLSPDYMAEGVREAARVLFNDALFQGACMASITLYAVAILNPEPLFSKLTAAVITAGLLTVFTSSEIYQLVSAWFRLREHAAGARTLAELDATAQDFGKAVGGTGLRVLVALATVFAGKALPAPRPGPTITPTAPAIATGSPTAAAAVARTLTIEGIQIIVLPDGTVVLPVLASVAASGAGRATSGATTGSGTSPASNAKPKTTSKPANKNVAGQTDSKVRPNQKTSISAAGGDRAGKPFTRAGKREVKTANTAAHGGQSTCTNCKKPTVPAQQSKRGVTPPSNETHVDHIIPKSKGGAGSPDNGQVLCRDCNLRKGAD